jgi:hypothetical protein
VTVRGSRGFGGFGKLKKLQAERERSHKLYFITLFENTVLKEDTIVTVVIYWAFIC